ncbi:MAG: hypothetical protein WCG80_13500 [Spirochaetales bacterium]
MNFGPIRGGLLENDGWIDFSRVMLFVGNQGSGKSTVAKLFSTFSWIEKALVRGDYDQRWFGRKNRLRTQFLKYHRLENFLELDGTDKATIEYEGDAYAIHYAQGQMTISERTSGSYHLPQVLYVPAERNFLAYVRNPQGLKLVSDALKEFVTEFENAKLSIRNAVNLPINGAELEYDKLNDLLNVRAPGYKLRLTDASSGFQSFVPLYLVSKHLADTVQQHAEAVNDTMSADELERFKAGVASIFSNESLTEEQKRAAISVLSSRFNKTAFVNIVEEPEQNLFPSSQWAVLQCLLEFNNQTKHNRLVMTSHSPYIVNFLSIAVQGQELSRKIESVRPGDKTLLNRLDGVVSRGALVDGSQVSIYQLDEDAGTIRRLESSDGFPSERNYLNDSLREGNRRFDELLEIEGEL